MRKESVTLIDDLDGSDESVRTVQFGWNGRDLEIDLSREHELEMLEAIRTYLSAARPAGRARPVRRTSEGRNKAAAVRQWAQDQGISVQDRGRIPASIIRQYENRQETGTL